MIPLSKDEILSLYIHIPFCSSKCDYCSFYSITNYSIYVDRFFEKIKNELTEVVNHLNNPFETIFIGGGNPPLLGLNNLKELIKIATTNGKAKEITIESNPENFTEEFLELRDVGVTRFSLGIQSLNEKHLKTLGRNSSLKDNLKALKLASSYKDIYFNIDLITTIPNQSIEECKEDVDKIINLVNPSHISLYDLTYEEGTLLAKKADTKLIKPLDDDQMGDMLLAMWNYLEQKGYEQYEVSNFAKSKKLRSQHNELTWQLKNYLGLGPSAVSTIGKTRISSIESVSNYVTTPLFSTYEIEELDTFTKMEEFLLVQLRLKEGLDKKLWFKMFKTDFDETFSEVITPLIKSAPYLFKENKENLILTKEALVISDAIVVRMISHLELLLDSEKMHVVP